MPSAKFHCATCRTERSFNDISRYSKNIIQGKGEEGAPRDVLICRFCMPHDIVSVSGSFDKLPAHVQNFISKWEYWDHKVGAIKMPPPGPVTKDKLLTYAEASEYAGIPMGTVYSAVSKGILNNVEVENRKARNGQPAKYIKQSDLDAYLDKRTAPDGAPAAPRAAGGGAPRATSLPGEPKNLKELAHAVYVRRKVERKRQLDVANELGINQGDMSKIELGRHSPPDKLVIVMDWMGYSEATKQKLLRLKGLQIPASVKGGNGNGNGHKPEVEDEPEKVFRTISRTPTMDEKTEKAIALLAAATGQSREDIMAEAIQVYVREHLVDALSEFGIEVTV